jgi:hypothetical protein
VISVVAMLALAAMLVILLPSLGPSRGFSGTKHRIADGTEINTEEPFDKGPFDKGPPFKRISVSFSVRSVPLRLDRRPRSLREVA